MGRTEQTISFEQTDIKVDRQNSKAKMKVLIKFKGQDFEIPDVSKAMTVKKFRTFVKDVTEVEPKLQNLYFGGKAMYDDCDLCDYKIENGYTIILMEKQRQPLAPIKDDTNRASKPSTPVKKEEKKGEIAGPSEIKAEKSKDERELTE